MNCIFTKPGKDEMIDRHSRWVVVCFIPVSMKAFGRCTRDWSGLSWWPAATVNSAPISHKNLSPKHMPTGTKSMSTNYHSRGYEKLPSINCTTSFANNRDEIHKRTQTSWNCRHSKQSNRVCPLPSLLISRMRSRSFPLNNASQPHSSMWTTVPSEKLPTSWASVKGLSKLICTMHALPSPKHSVPHLTRSTK
jgi:hypothetical protein